MKRVFDFTGALIGLILLFPTFLITSILIKINDWGPILFKQLRVGRNGKSFVLYKFRSMNTVRYFTEDAFEPGNNTRITSVGRYLRKNKIDELPQLFNVIKGDMSFVGPRPEVKKWTEIYPEKWAAVLSVKPGITDNATIEFRNEEDLLSKSKDPEMTYRDKILPRKLDLYIDYVNNRTFIGDLTIIFRTIKAILLK